MPDDGGHGGIEQPVVIHIGSASIAAGFAGDDEPRVRFPAVVGWPRSKGVMVGMGKKDHYPGHEAASKRGLCNLSYPIERGSVAGWRDLEKLLHYCFYVELRVAPENHAVIVTDFTLNPTGSREKLTQLLLEVLRAPAMNVCQVAVLDMLAADRTTGVAVHVDDGVTNVVAVKDERAVPHASIRLDVGGDDLTAFMLKLVADRGEQTPPQTLREIIPTVKESLAYVALDYPGELSRNPQPTNPAKTHELSDGQVISFGKELFQGPEVLFRPSLIGRDSPGIHQAVFKAIMSCDAPIRSELFANIVLAGPESTYPGLAERLEREMKTLAPPATKIGVIAPPMRKDAAWIGGSILAMRDLPAQWWMTQNEYEEHGAQCIHTKAF